jgi:hypothetical protein
MPDVLRRNRDASVIPGNSGVRSADTNSHACSETEPDQCIPQAMTLFPYRH